MGRVWEHNPFLLVPSGREISGSSSLRQVVRRCQAVAVAEHAAVITSIYLQGIDTSEIINTVHDRRPPVIPASAGLNL